MSEIKQTGCCPRFDPAPWNGKILEWQDKKFVKDHVCTLFYMPINFGSVMKRLSKKVKEAGAESRDWLCLSDHTSKWSMNVYLAVDKEISSAENINMSGKFLSKVYEGSFKDTGKWCADFGEYAKSKNLEVKKMYMWYTTCPKCAKTYGKNYTVIIGQL